MLGPEFKSTPPTNSLGSMRSSRVRRRPISEASSFPEKMRSWDSSHTIHQSDSHFGWPWQDFHVETRNRTSPSSKTVIRRSSASGEYGRDSVGFGENRNGRACQSIVNITLGAGDDWGAHHTLTSSRPKTAPVNTLDDLSIYVLTSACARALRSAYSGNASHRSRTCLRTLLNTAASVR
jgi:hypothetical protein